MQITLHLGPCGSGILSAKSPGHFQWRVVKRIDRVRREPAALLERELHRLPAKYRDAVQLHDLHGLSVAETARLLELNESTLRTRLVRGRRLLRSRLSRLLLVVPWWLTDNVGAAALTMGVVMKTKLGLAALAVALLAVGLTVRHRARDQTAAPLKRDTSGRTQRSASDAAGNRRDEKAVDATRNDTTSLSYAAGVVVDAAGARDHPTILGLTLLSGGATLAGIVLADLAYATFDPRVRRG